MNHYKSCNTLPQSLAIIFQDLIQEYSSASFSKHCSSHFFFFFGLFKSWDHNTSKSSSVFFFYLLLYPHAMLPCCHVFILVINFVALIPPFPTSNPMILIHNCTTLSLHEIWHQISINHSYYLFPHIWFIVLPILWSVLLKTTAIQLTSLKV